MVAPLAPKDAHVQPDNTAPHRAGGGPRGTQASRGPSTAGQAKSCVPSAFGERIPWGGGDDVGGVLGASPPRRPESNIGQAMPSVCERRITDADGAILAVFPGSVG
jgi:hypothetical protein